MFPGEAHELPNVLRPLAGVDETSGHEAALQLQRAILPTPLQRFSLGRYDLSVRYRPAESGNRVCGDWYDARLGPDDRAVVAIGDVAGHDLFAAARMARIGNALRGLSVTGQPLGGGGTRGRGRPVPLHRRAHRAAGPGHRRRAHGPARRRWRRAGQTADEAIAALLGRLDPPAAEDDVCLLAVRVR